MGNRRVLVALCMLAPLMATCAAPPNNTTGGTTVTPEELAAAITSNRGPAPEPNAPPPVVPGEVLVRPSGGDDTAVLVAAIQQHPAIVIDRPLRIDQVATVTASNRTISFRGAGALIRSHRPAVVTFQILLFVGSRNVTINDPVIVGPTTKCDNYGAGFEEQHAISLEGVDGVTINGGTFSNIPGDGLFIFYNHRTNPSTPSANVTVNGLTTRCTGRSSISNISSSNVTVNGGDFDIAGRWIFNVEPFNALSVHNYRINHPKVGRSKSRWLYVGGPYYRCGTTKVTAMVVTGAQVVPGAVPASVIGCSDVTIRP